MFKDLSGEKFNRLTVLKFSRRRGANYLWECLCECGAKSIVDGFRLKTGRIKSCGCLKCSKTKTKKNSYRSWYCMVERCTNKENIGYQDYGGRGILVCHRWLIFENFYEDMGNRPSLKHSIERKDTNGNYEPSNCIWATPSEQSRNKRNNIWLEFGGERMVLKDWADRLKVSQTTIMVLIRGGTKFEDVVDRYTIKNTLSGTTASSRIILDTQTGIFYDSIQSASNAKSIPYSSLNHKLNGYKYRKNDTGLVFV